MKVILGAVAVLVLVASLGATPVMGVIPMAMAESTAYNDGYRQGVSDSIHPIIPPLVENPTGNQNITDFVNGHAQAMKDVQSGPFGVVGSHLNKKSMEFADGWFAGSIALAHNLTISPMGHNLDFYDQGWYNGRYPTN